MSRPFWTAFLSQIIRCLNQQLFYHKKKYIIEEI